MAKIKYNPPGSKQPKAVTFRKQQPMSQANPAQPRTWQYPQFTTGNQYGPWTTPSGYDPISGAAYYQPNLRPVVYAPMQLGYQSQFGQPGRTQATQARTEKSRVGYKYPRFVQDAGALRDADKAKRAGGGSGYGSRVSYGGSGYSSSAVAQRPQSYGLNVNVPQWIQTLVNWRF